METKIEELKEKKTELEKLLELVDKMVADEDFMNRMATIRMFFKLGLDDISTFKEFRKSLSREIQGITEKIKELEKTEG